MNYTDATKMKNAMGGKEAVQDDLLTRFAEIASRDIDHICAQTSSMDCENYFFLQTIVGEFLTNAKIDENGHLVCYPHKSQVLSASSVSFATIPSSFISVDPSLIVTKPHAVEVWGDYSEFRGKPLLVTVNYVGGMATSIDELSDTLVDIATVIAIRKYKEERSGMSDVVGVVELGTVQYSKAMPANAEYGLVQFMRVVPWT
jgi:hypothetical protein